VRIFEYGPTMLHVRALTIDGAWSTIGSVSFDNRSFQLQDEATLCVQSVKVAGRLAEQSERDLSVSEAIRESRWKDRPLRQRARERAMVFARPELLGAVPTTS
jgi:cardiolipin synthase